MLETLSFIVLLLCISLPSSAVGMSLIASTDNYAELIMNII